MPIRNNLPVIMAQRNIRSYSELSRRTKLNYATIRNFAMGKHQRFDANVIEAICKAVNCDLKDLLYIEKKEA